MIRALPFVLDGLLKVSRNEEDKEILLYYIKPGESCVMSFSACISHRKSEIKAVTETETELLLIPSYLIEEMVKKHFFLNQYFHDLYNRRYLDLLDTVDDLIFRKMDERILHYLEERTIHFDTRHLKLTHAEIAHDLGSAREVVSRVLKKLEKDGKLKITRNEIILL